MKNKEFCPDCKKLISRKGLVVFKGYRICNSCFLKRSSRINLPMGPMLFDDYVTRQVHFCMMLTEGQFKDFKKRIKETSQGARFVKGKNAYLRNLILKDIKNG